MDEQIKFKKTTEQMEKDARSEVNGNLFSFATWSFFLRRKSFTLNQYLHPVLSNTIQYASSIRPFGFA